MSKYGKSLIALPWSWCHGHRAPPTDCRRPYWPYSKIIYDIVTKNLPCTLTHVKSDIPHNNLTLDFPCGCPHEKAIAYSDLSDQRQKDTIRAHEKFQSFVYYKDEGYGHFYWVPPRRLYYNNPTAKSTSLKRKRRKTSKLTDRKYRRNGNLRIPAHLQIT